uniref:BED-type domain-containing protein n=1 Tax=Seriola dumerili TaxID=41447 RepID=A0A3B4V8W1_SERDU
MLCVDTPEPPREMTRKRSMVWGFFKTVDSQSVQCLLCRGYQSRQVQGSTTAMLRHLRVKHPKEVFSRLVADGLKPPPSSSNCSVELSQRKLIDIEFQNIIYFMLCFYCIQGRNETKSSDGERRVLRRERELIEALRRTQKEEARALEHQRELLEKLRAADAKEAAVEREKIESLRKAQQEEAKELNTQREELQKEKAELQKKWEELQQEREELLLFSRGQ